MREMGVSMLMRVEVTMQETSTLEAVKVGRLMQAAVIGMVAVGVVGTVPTVRARMISLLVQVAQVVRTAAVEVLLKIVMTAAV